MRLFDLSAYQWAQADLFGEYVEFHNWGYPLPILLISRPFSALPYLAALALWTVLGIAAYLMASLRELTTQQRGFAIVVLLLAPASVINVIGGQNGFFTAALVLGAQLRCGMRDRGSPACWWDCSRSSRISESSLLSRCSRRAHGDRTCGGDDCGGNDGCILGGLRQRALGRVSHACTRDAVAHLDGV
jgi:hypothetical protein